MKKLFSLIICAASILPLHMHAQPPASESSARSGGSPALAVQPSALFENEAPRSKKLSRHSRKTQPHKQPKIHAHNDYEQPQPFYGAFTAGCGSIEADIFLEKDQLLVAHYPSQFDPSRTIETLYLRPLDSILRSNNGYLSPDTAHRLQLMIDIKTSALPTLRALIAGLERYPSIISSSAVRIAISGNRPPPETFAGYPAFIFFDAVPAVSYPQPALARIVMYSDNFRSYSSWAGTGAIPAADMAKLKDAVDRAHALKKPFRFWNAPDNEATWKELKKIGVDWINTDKTAELANFLKIN